MASPNTGLFASSFVDGFLQQKKEQKDRFDKNKIIKLQTKLIEQQLLSGKLKLDAQTTLADALTGSPPLDIESELGPDEVGPPVSRAGREPLGLAGLISELRNNPEFLNAAFQSGQLGFRDILGGQQGQEPSNVRALRAVGIDPQSDVGREAILSNLDAGADDNAMAQLMLGLQTEKLAEQKRERDVAEKTESEARIGRRQAVRNDFANARRIIELQQDLEGTAFATGTPYGKLLRDIGAGLNALIDVAGFDVAKAKDLIAKRDELGKLFADGTLEAVDRFKGTGTITNQKFEALVAASPEIGKTEIANAQVLATRMRAVLDAAERKGEIVPNRAEIEAWIAKMKGLSATAQTGARNIGDTAQSGFDAATVFARDTADKARSGFDAATGFAQPVVEAASDVTQRKLAELQQIDFSKLSQEQLDAIAKIAQAGAKKVQPLLDAATEKAKSGLATAAEIAKMSIEQLNQLDLQGMGEDALKAAEKRWKELNAK